MYPFSKFGTKAVKTEDVPITAHWQIWLQESYTPVTGYEDEPGGGGTRTTKWVPYVYTAEDEWRADLMALYKKANDPKNIYSRTEFLGFEAGGRVQAEVSIHFAGAPRRGT
jgi:hypothetical protein